MKSFLSSGRKINLFFLFLFFLSVFLIYDFKSYTSDAHLLGETKQRVNIDNATYKKLDNAGMQTIAIIEHAQMKEDEIDIDTISILHITGKRRYFLSAKNATDTKDTIRFSDGFELTADNDLNFKSLSATYYKKNGILDSDEAFDATYKEADVFGIGYKIYKEQQKLEAKKIFAKVKNL